MIVFETIPLYFLLKRQKCILRLMLSNSGELKCFFPFIFLKKSKDEMLYSVNLNFKMCVDLAGKIYSLEKSLWTQNTLTQRIFQLANADAVVGGCIVEADGCHLKNVQIAGRHASLNSAMIDAAQFALTGCYKEGGVN